MKPIKKESKILQEATNELYRLREEGKKVETQIVLAKDKFRDLYTPTEKE